MKTKRIYSKKLYQIDALLTKERGGSGLGLAICKEIIESHGETIGVKSNQEKGSLSFLLCQKTSPVNVPRFS